MLKSLLGMKLYYPASFIGHRRKLASMLVFHTEFLSVHVHCMIMIPPAPFHDQTSCESVALIWIDPARFNLLPIKTIARPTKKYKLVPLFTAHNPTFIRNVIESYMYACYRRIVSHKVSGLASYNKMGQAD